MTDAPKPPAKKPRTLSRTMDAIEKLLLPLPKAEALALLNMLQIRAAAREDVKA